MKFEYTPANIFAKIVSGVIHPIAMPTLGGLLIFNLNNNLTLKNEENFRLLLLGGIFVFTFILPGLMIIALRLLGVISSVSLNNQNERRLPFMATAVSYTLCYYFLLKLKIGVSIFPYNMAYPLMLGATLSVILALIVNTWFKISIHMMGIGGLTGSFIAIALKYDLPLGGLIMVLIGLCGLTGYARLQLNAHTPAQVYSGFLVSAISNGLLIHLLIPS